MKSKFEKHLVTESPETDKSYKYMDKIMMKADRNHLLIDGWRLDQDMGGGYFFDKKGSKSAVYATPFWEGDKGISLSIVDKEEGKSTDSVVPMTITNDESKDLATYISIMKKVLSKVK